MLQKISFLVFQLVIHFNLEFGPREVEIIDLERFLCLFFTTTSNFYCADSTLVKEKFGGMLILGSRDKVNPQKPTRLTSQFLRPHHPQKRYL